RGGHAPTLRRQGAASRERSRSSQGRDELRRPWQDRARALADGRASHEAHGLAEDLDLVVVAEAHVVDRPAGDEDRAALVRDVDQAKARLVAEDHGHLTRGRPALELDIGVLALADDEDRLLEERVRLLAAAVVDDQVATDARALLALELRERPL